MSDYRVYWSKSERGYTLIRGVDNADEAMEKFWEGDYDAFAENVERADYEVGDIEEA